MALNVHSICGSNHTQKTRLWDMQKKIIRIKLIKAYHEREEEDRSNFHIMFILYKDGITRIWVQTCTFLITEAIFVVATKLLIISNKNSHQFFFVPLLIKGTEIWKGNQEFESSKSIYNISRGDESHWTRIYWWFTVHGCDGSYGSQRQKSSPPPYGWWNGGREEYSA